MRCLSLWRPWPYWIAMGQKTIETRAWFKLPEYLVGERLAFHAAQKRDERAVDEARNATGCSIGVPPEYANWPTGIICHARVERVQWLNDLIHARRALCRCNAMAGICLTDIVRLREPVRYRGHKGLFYVPDALVLGTATV